jgi:hypothetical protein
MCFLRLKNDPKSISSREEKLACKHQLVHEFARESFKKGGELLVGQAQQKTQPVHF